VTRALIEAMLISAAGILAAVLISLPWPGVAGAVRTVWAAWRFSCTVRRIAKPPTGQELRKIGLLVSPPAPAAAPKPPAPVAWNAPSDPLYGGRHAAVREVLDELRALPALERVRDATVSRLTAQRDAYRAVVARNAACLDRDSMTRDRAAYLREQMTTCRILAEDYTLILAVIERDRPNDTVVMPALAAAGEPR
jgi:hypothetical protein